MAWELCYNILYLRDSPGSVPKMSLIHYQRAKPS